MAATAFDDLEQGHASTFFNPLWTQLGANLSGPEVTRQFFEKALRYHNLRRRWDGGYGDWGTEGADAGVALLVYCLPRKALIITGRDADRSIWVRGDAATEVVMRSKVDYDRKSTRELIALLGDPIPQVPYAVLNALGKRKDKEIVPALMTLSMC